MRSGSGFFAPGERAPRPRRLSDVSNERSVEGPAIPGYDVASLRRLAAIEVRVRLRDGSLFHGRFRTGLLTDRSLSVFLAEDGGEGVTLYIDQIAEIVPTTLSAP